MKASWSLGLLGFALLASPIAAVEVNGEILMGSVITKEQKLTSKIDAALFVQMVQSEKLTAVLEYQFSDQDPRINKAYGKFIQQKVELTVGRQLTGWGSGYNFNPTDIFNQKPLGAAFDQTYHKKGRDALLLTYYPNSHLAIDAIYALPFNETSYDPLPLNKTGDQDGGVHLKVHYLATDWEFLYMKKGKRTYSYTLDPQSPLAIRDPPDQVWGLSVQTTLPLWDIGFWAEGAYYKNQKKYEYVGGIERSIGNTSINIEYYRNGFGHKNPQNYQQRQLLQGRLVARDYLVPSLAYSLDEKLSLAAFLFYNMNDKSNAAGGGINYLYHDQGEIILMPFFLGGSPSTDFGQQAKTAGEYGLQGIIKLTF